MNKKRNIPFELSEEENKLYSYSQAITLNELEEIAAKYKEGIKSQEAMEDEGDIDELPMLSHN